MKQSTVLEMFKYNDWANDWLMNTAAALDDEQWDRPFEMGMGSLRKTMQHLYQVERLWLERWKGVMQPPLPSPDDVSTTHKLRQCFGTVMKDRGAFVDQLGEAGLARTISYRNVKGEQFSNRFGDMMHHVCNHGSHHRAQALNMLRRLGVKVSNIDYLVMKRREAPETPQPTYAPTILRAFFAYGDWANGRMLDAAQALGDDQLDKPFEMGFGTLRRTLSHIRDAEQWWSQNWLEGPERPFPGADAGISLGALRQSMGEIAAARNAFLARATDGDLQNPVSALVRPGMTLTFPLGASMVQLGFHGTHHRAQVVNMLRHLGATVPPLDFIVWVREQSAGGK